MTIHYVKLSPPSGHAAGLLVAALVLSILPAALAGEIPPYPYQYPPWMLALREKLKVPMIDDLQKTPIREGLKKITAATGVNIRVSREVLKAVDTPVSVSFKDQPAESALRILLESCGLAYKLTETEVVVINPNQVDANLAEAVRIGEWIEYVRKQRFPTKPTKEEKAAQEAEAARRKKAEKEQADEIEKQKEALRSTKVTRDFVDVSLQDIVRALEKASKVPLVFSKEALKKAQSGANKLAVKGGGRSVEKVLDELVRSHGLKYAFKEGVCVVHLDGENIEPQYFCFWKAEQEEAERTILRLKLTGNSKSSRVCDLVDELARDIGVKVFPDSQAWKEEVEFPKKTAAITVRQLAAILKRKGIEVVVGESPLSCQQRWVTKAVGRQRAKPAGIADVDWSIYLLQRKK